MKELYSSRVHTFRVLGRQSHPRRDGPDLAASIDLDAWHLLGSFDAENKRGSQSFTLPHKRRVRYLLVKFDTHYGSEAMCALNTVEVLGVSAAQELEEALSQQDNEDEAAVLLSQQDETIVTVPDTVQAATDRQAVQAGTVQVAAGADSALHVQQSVIDQTASKVPHTGSSDGHATNEGTVNRSEHIAGGQVQPQAVRDNIAAGLTTTQPALADKSAGNGTGTLRLPLDDHRDEHASRSAAGVQTNYAAGNPLQPDRQAHAAHVNGSKGGAGTKEGEPDANMLPAQVAEDACAAGSSSAQCTAIPAGAAACSSTGAASMAQAVAQQPPQQQQLMMPDGNGKASATVNDAAALLEGRGSNKPKQAGNLFDVIKSEMLQLKLEQGKLTKKLDSLSKRHSELEQTTNRLHQQNQELKQAFHTLASSIDDVVRTKVRQQMSVMDHGQYVVHGLVMRPCLCCCGVLVQHVCMFSGVLLICCSRILAMSCWLCRYRRLSSKA